MTIIIHPAYFPVFPDYTILNTVKIILIFLDLFNNRTGNSCLVIRVYHSAKGIASQFFEFGNILAAKNTDNCCICIKQLLSFIRSVYKEAAGHHSSYSLYNVHCLFVQFKMLTKHGLYLQN